MEKAALVLQYPDPRKGRTVVLAATTDPIALKAFKRAVIKKAKKQRDSQSDKLLRFVEDHEVLRLRDVLGVLIPER